jgi:hypothetical protein
VGHGSQDGPAQPLFGVEALTQLPLQYFNPGSQPHDVPLSNKPLGHTQSVPDEFLMYPEASSHVKSHSPEALQNVVSV